MKDIINIDINAKKTTLDKCKTDMLVLGLFEEENFPNQIKEIDKKLQNPIKKIVDIGDFKAKTNTSTIVYTNSKITPTRILLVGLGEKKKADMDTFRKAAAYAAQTGVSKKIKNIAIALHISAPAKFDLAETAKAIAEGAYFGSYQYDEFVTNEKNQRLNSLNVSIVEPDTKYITLLKKGIAQGIIIGKAQSNARTLANRPPNVITPIELAKIAKKIAAEIPNLFCTIFDEKQLKQKNMGGILAVGAGSKNPPRLIILKYMHKKQTSKKTPTIAIVGKAITFDSGGISLKPGADMDQMKFDKTGGIVTLAVIQAIAQLKLPINLYALIPAAENMPGASSYRPGDIITTFSKKTVEVLNTDAEGRLILCDAIAYADSQLKADIIIDIATLTGACMVALGKHMAGLMGDDDELINDIKKASEQSGEKTWHLPSGEEYADEIKSKIADLKNIGSRWGGASTAAAFLSQFKQNAKWAHLDIAGMDLFEKPTAYSASGSSGFGVRLLIQYLINSIKK